MARRINLEEITMRAPVEISEPLLGLHPDNTSWAVDGEVEGEKAEGKVEEGATGFM